MGKQIRFFMHGNDELKFLEIMEEQGDSIVDDKANPIEINKLKQFFRNTVEEVELTQFFMIFPESKLIRDENGFIEPIESDVIEFSRCSIESENMVWAGRIWAEFNYYDNNDAMVKKDKWFEQKFNKYRNWIKKNLRISVDKGYYIGEEAYKLYKEKGYRMKAGPKVEIKF